METELIRQLERLMKVARLADYGEALTFLGAHVRDLRKTERERSWPWGRCLFCEIESNRLREAVVFDTGGGPPTCEQHAR